jgi:hypothetical protein
MSLRNNILFVDNALKAYEYVNVDSEITRIFFAITQASLLNDINKEIHKYLDALERGECREVLGIDFKKMTHKCYWKKGNRLPSDMVTLKRKKLAEYGINYAIDGHCLEHTGHVYEMIEAGIAELTTLLKDVRRKTLNAPAGMFSAFFHNEASERGNEWAETEYDEWKMNLGKLTFERLKAKQTLVVAEFLMKGVLRYAAPPTVRELNEVQLDKVREDLPSDFELSEDFKEQCAKFRRFISWQGDTLIIDYDCYGKYFFQFFNRFTVEDQQAMFALDHTLKLIHEDMAACDHSPKENLTHNEGSEHQTALDHALTVMDTCSTLLKPSVPRNILKQYITEAFYGEQKKQMQAKLSGQSCHTLLCNMVGMLKASGKVFREEVSLDELAYALSSIVNSPKIVSLRRYIAEGAADTKTDISKWTTHFIKQNFTE